MTTRVQKWGNSQGVRLSKDVLEEAAIRVGDEVEIAVKDGTVVVTPARRVRGGHDLGALVSALPTNEHSDELDWGGPMGNEVW